MHQHLAVVRLLDEVVQHLLSVAKIGNHAIFHRLDGNDVARRAAQHLFRFLAHGFHFVCVLIHRDDGRLVHHDSLAFGIDQRVRGAEVNG